ncbi:hypothetical protein ASG01_13590 [Chryseobacterium sp. Leaf180]|jgi:hypothetical protein|uniref:hypothetical protein n=1 Tax=Chryseobacterium sp. Leaf180 TaxID=1736289 RepID=UPI0007001071|nr:hypothetical protein [Chryseobacterium sp. Leaf180]KQR92025.1 hypothetical protein ASG01_13590 [Chryseobacterium sp. Leaf180]
MILRESRNLRSFISRLMFGIYFFALFFSSFHSHESPRIFADSNFKKQEKSIQKSDLNEKSGDCLACHFLATGNTLLPDDFTFITLNHTSETLQSFAVQDKIWSQTKFNFQLRGPPVHS